MNEQQEAELILNIQAEGALRRIIAGYQSCRGGRVNHGRTDEVRKQLSELEVRTDGKRDSVKTLALVQTALSKIAD
jgi:hypothetical protein